MLVRDSDVMLDEALGTIEPSEELAKSELEDVSIEVLIGAIVVLLCTVEEARDAEIAEDSGEVPASY